MAIFSALIFIAVLSYAGWTLYDGYRQSTVKGWHRWIDAAEKSATILWAKAGLAGGAVTGLLIDALDYFNDPAIGAWIKAHVPPQVWVGLFLLFAYVGIRARKRTL